MPALLTTIAWKITSQAPIRPHQRCMGTFLFLRLAMDSLVRVSLAASTDYVNLLYLLCYPGKDSWKWD